MPSSRTPARTPVRIDFPPSSSGCWARSRARTCTTTTSRPRSWSISAPIGAGPRRSWRSRPVCWSCTATRPSTRSRSSSKQRGGAFYSEAAAALVASLHAGTGDVQVVNVRNAGAIPNLPDDDIVEIPARIDRDGAHPETDGAARAGDARHRPAREGVRAPHDRGGDHGRPDDGAQGPDRQSAGRRLRGRRSPAR